jgi:ABC-type antimicrobial peptide transport system permease subunit
VLKQTAIVVLAGIGFGLIGAVVLARTETSLLYGVSPFDSASFIFATTLLALSASVAALLPARRATRIDPSSALRQE